MPIAKETSSFTPAPAGTHIARCYGCISLGTQHSELFADAFKIVLLFELPFERLTNGVEERPMTINKEYSLSLGKKSTLRRHLDSWRGRPFTEQELKGFEVSKVVGAPCQLTIIHVKNNAGEMRARIETIVGLSKGMTAPPQENPSVIFEIEEGESEIFRGLPEWLQKKIRACDEWAPRATAPAPTAPVAPAPVPAPAPARVAPVAQVPTAPVAAPLDQVEVPGDDEVPF